MGRDSSGVTFIPMADALAGLKDAQDCQVCIPLPWATIWCSLTAARGDAKQTPQGHVPSLVNVNSSIYTPSLVNHEEHEHAQARGYSWLSFAVCISMPVRCLCSFNFTLSASVTGKQHLSTACFCEPCRRTMGSAIHQQSTATNYKKSC